MEKNKVTKEELLEKAKKPAQDALKMHPYYKGKIEVVPKFGISTILPSGILPALQNHARRSTRTLIWAMNTQTERTWLELLLMVQGFSGLVI